MSVSRCDVMAVLLASLCSRVKYLVEPHRRTMGVVDGDGFRAAVAERVGSSGWDDNAITRCGRCPCATDIHLERAVKDFVRFLRRWMDVQGSPAAPGQQIHFHVEGSSAGVGGRLPDAKDHADPAEVQGIASAQTSLCEDGSVEVHRAGSRKVRDSVGNLRTGQKAGPESVRRVRGVLLSARPNTRPGAIVPSTSSTTAGESGFVKWLSKPASRALRRSSS